MVVWTAAARVTCSTGTIHFLFRLFIGFIPSYLESFLIISLPFFSICVVLNLFWFKTQLLYSLKMNKFLKTALALCFLIAVTQSIKCYVGAGSLKTETDCSALSSVVNATSCAKYKVSILSTYACGSCLSSYSSCTTCNSTDLCNGATTHGSPLVFGAVLLPALYYLF